MLRRCFPRAAAVAASLPKARGSSSGVSGSHQGTPVTTATSAALRKLNAVAAVSGVPTTTTTTNDTNNQQQQQQQGESSSTTTRDDVDYVIGTRSAPRLTYMTAFGVFMTIFRPDPKLKEPRMVQLVNAYRSLPPDKLAQLKEKGKQFPFWVSRVIKPPRRRKFYRAPTRFNLYVREHFKSARHIPANRRLAYLWKSYKATIQGQQEQKETDRRKAIRIKKSKAWKAKMALYAERNAIREARWKVVLEAREKRKILKAPLEAAAAVRRAARQKKKLLSEQKRIAVAARIVANAEKRRLKAKMRQHEIQKQQQIIMS